MTEDPLDALVAQIKALPQEGAFHLYLKLAKEDRERAQIAALAIRDKARAGEIEEKVIPLLEQCLVGSPDDHCVVHFAKTCAAFGRVAQSCAKILAQKIREMRIVDDATFWIFDGSLWSLGYLGGPEATKLLRELESETPTRAVRAGNVYRGKMTAEQRAAHWTKTIDGVRALIAAADPGVWREKKTSLKGQRPKASTARKPWER